MRLEPEQEELLEILVEASRKVSRDKREFWLVRVAEGDLIQAASLSETLIVQADDIHVLAEAGLLRITNYGEHGELTFYVNVDGMDYYERLKKRAGNAVVQVEQDIRSYIDSESFCKRHREAYERWSEAAELVWRADSERDLTAIGHKVREAMQSFASSLVGAHQPPAANPDPVKTLDRVSAVINLRRSELGQSRSAFLDALCAHCRPRRSFHGTRKRRGGGELRRRLTRTGRFAPPGRR